MAVSERRPSATLLRPDQIADQRFKIGRRGYETGEVEAYLHDLAGAVERMQDELEWLRVRSDHLERRNASAQEAAYVRLARDFTSAIKAADERARHVIADARREADGIVARARAEAAGIIAAGGPEMPPAPPPDQPGDLWSSGWQTGRPQLAANDSAVSAASPADSPDAVGDLDLDLGIDDSLFDLFDGPGPVDRP